MIRIELDACRLELRNGVENANATMGRLIVAALVILHGSPVTAQPSAAESVCPDNTPSVFHACALSAATRFDPPRTLDGLPDLGGVWRLPGNAFEDLEDHPETLDDNGNPAIVVDPPNGRVPMQPWADALRRENVTAYVHPAAACFLSGVPYIMYRPALYQLLQTPEYFVVLGERAHGYRVVDLVERPPVGEGIQLWNGVSRGRWDGNTLVIETTNQNAKPWLDQRARFYTEEMQVEERLTLVDPNTLHYQATITDPNVYTRPFTIALAYRRADAGAELLEESCYENNAALLNIYRSLGLTIYTGMSPDEARREGERVQ